MKIIKTEFNGLLIYNKNSYYDKRGYFRESIFKNTLKLLFLLMSCRIQKKMF